MIKIDSLATMTNILVIGILVINNKPILLDCQIYPGEKERERNIQPKLTQTQTQTETDGHTGKHELLSNVTDKQAGRHKQAGWQAKTTNTAIRDTILRSIWSFCKIVTHLAARFLTGVSICNIEHGRIKMKRPLTTANGTNFDLQHETQIEIWRGEGCKESEQTLTSRRMKLLPNLDSLTFAHSHANMRKAVEVRDLSRRKSTHTQKFSLLLMIPLPKLALLLALCWPTGLRCCALCDGHIVEAAQFILSPGRM